MLTRTWTKWTARALLCTAALLPSSCLAETFDPPPSARIAGAINGLIENASPADPVRVLFSEPYVTSSLRLKLVTAAPGVDLDPEERLPDEQTPKRRLNVLMSYDGASGITTGGTVTTSADGSLALKPDKVLAVAANYMVVLEPGLEDLEGNVTVPRVRLPFAYAGFDAGASSLVSGYYYFLMIVEPPPLRQQLQLYSWLEVDQQAGTFTALFTDADRLPALNARPGCPACDDGLVCALLPKPECQVPSHEQQTVDQFSDWLPITEAPEGYTFLVNGNTADQPDGSIAIGTDPFDIDITIGAAMISVVAERVVFTGTLAPDNSDEGRLRGAGSLSVEAVKLNGNGDDPTKGTFSVMALTSDEVDGVESFGTAIPKP